MNFTFKHVWCNFVYVFGALANDLRIRLKQIIRVLCQKVGLDCAALSAHFDSVGDRHITPCTCSLGAAVVLRDCTRSCMI